MLGYVRYSHAVSIARGPMKERHMSLARVSTNVFFICECKSSNTKKNPPMDISIDRNDERDRHVLIMFSDEKRFDFLFVFFYR